MEPDENDIRERALQLPEQKRVALAGELLDSLVQEAEPGVDEAWRTEVRTRVHQLDAGDVTAVAEEEFFSSMDE